MLFTALDPGLSASHMIHGYQWRFAAPSYKRPSWYYEESSLQTSNSILSCRVVKDHLYLNLDTWDTWIYRDLVRLIVIHITKDCL